MLSIEIIADLTKLEAFVPEWSVLFVAVTPKTPSKSPLWCLAWWRRYRRHNVWAFDDMRVYVLRDQNGRLVGVAPMIVTRRPGYGAFCLRELQYFGADPYITQLRGPVCRGEDLSAVCEALSTRILADKCCDWVQWQGLPLTGFKGQPANFQPERGLGDVDYCLNLSGSWDLFLERAPKKTRKAVRRYYKDLQADEIAFEFRVLTRAEEAPEALAKLYELHRLRSEMTDPSVEHPNLFAPAKARHFIEDYCHGLALEGGLRLFQLLIGGEIVATRLGFAMGDELELYFSGYDPKWAKYSIMTILIAEVIKWSNETGVRVLSLGSGRDRSKTRWNPQAFETSGGYTHNNWKSRLALSALVARRHGRKPISEDPRQDCESRQASVGVG